MGFWLWCRCCTLLRIFNPILQGEKFDPNGDYVRRWVPELSKLPTKYIHSTMESTKRSFAGERSGTWEYIPLSHNRPFLC